MCQKRGLRECRVPKDHSKFRCRNCLFRGKACSYVRDPPTKTEGGAKPRASAGLKTRGRKAAPKSALVLDDSDVEEGEFLRSMLAPVTLVDTPLMSF